MVCNVHHKSRKNSLTLTKYMKKSNLLNPFFHIRIWLGTDTAVLKPSDDQLQMSTEKLEKPKEFRPQHVFSTMLKNLNENLPSMMPLTEIISRY